jgi:hypothetical protein
VTVIQWPPFSPDLNPIETYWAWIKNYLEDKYGMDEKPTYPRLRRYVKEAWEALPENFLVTLFNFIPARCEAVIEANGIHTRY